MNFQIICSGEEPGRKVAEDLCLNLAGRSPKPGFSGIFHLNGVEMVDEACMFLERHYDGMTFFVMDKKFMSVLDNRKAFKKIGQKITDFLRIGREDQVLFINIDVDKDVMVELQSDLGLLETFEHRLISFTTLQEIANYAYWCLIRHHPTESYANTDSRRSVYEGMTESRLDSANLGRLSITSFKNDSQVQSLPQHYYQPTSATESADNLSAELTRMAVENHWSLSPENSFKDSPIGTRIPPVGDSSPVSPGVNGNKTTSLPLPVPHKSPDQESTRCQSESVNRTRQQNTGQTTPHNVHRAAQNQSINSVQSTDLFHSQDTLESQTGPVPVQHDSMPESPPLVHTPPVPLQAFQMATSPDNSQACSGPFVMPNGPQMNPVYIDPAVMSQGVRPQVPHPGYRSDDPGNVNRAVLFSGSVNSGEMQEATRQTVSVPSYVMGDMEHLDAGLSSPELPNSSNTDNHGNCNETFGLCLNCQQTKSNITFALRPEILRQESLPMYQSLPQFSTFGPRALSLADVCKGYCADCLQRKQAHMKSISIPDFSSQTVNSILMSDEEKKKKLYSMNSHVSTSSSPFKQSQGSLGGQSSVQRQRPSENRQMDQLTADFGKLFNTAAGQQANRITASMQDGINAITHAYQNTQTQIGNMPVPITSQQIYLRGNPTSYVNPNQHPQGVVIGSNPPQQVNMGNNGSFQRNNVQLISGSSEQKNNQRSGTSQSGQGGRHAIEPFNRSNSMPVVNPNLQSNEMNLLSHYGAQGQSRSPNSLPSNLQSRGVYINPNIRVGDPDNITYSIQSETDNSKCKGTEKFSKNGNKSTGMTGMGGQASCLVADDGASGGSEMLGDMDATGAENPHQMSATDLPLKIFEFIRNELDCAQIYNWKNLADLHGMNYREINEIAQQWKVHRIESPFEHLLKRFQRYTVQQLRDDLVRIPRHDILDQLKRWGEKGELPPEIAGLFTT